jgi:hypothetical protein
MPDIRDVLKGLSIEDRAIYTEVRTQMRRAYLYAHSKTLPIDQYTEEDDAFLDMCDIKIAMLFDRAGVFNHVEGNLNTEAAKEVEKTLHDASDSLATRMMKGNSGWTTKQ